MYIIEKDDFLYYTCYYNAPKECSISCLIVWFYMKEVKGCRSKVVYVLKLMIVENDNTSSLISNNQ